MITFTFKKGGAVTVKPEGYPGEACRRATAGYLAALGGEVVRDEPTPEASEEAPVVAPDAAQAHAG